MTESEFLAAGGLPSTLVDSFAATLAADVDSPGSVDRSLIAYALALPSLSELSDATGPPVDPLALVAARKMVKRTLASANKELLAKAYEATMPPEEFSIEGGEIGRRQIGSTPPLARCRAAVVLLLAAALLLARKLDGELRAASVHGLVRLLNALRV